MGGRFVWSSTSDYIGRRNTYFVFCGCSAVLSLHGALYRCGRQCGSGFVLCFLVIISMWYGGGLATVPAYLRDMFGTRYVGAIHGLLLTAWSMAGIFGPVLVAYYIPRVRQRHPWRYPKAQAPTTSPCTIMAGLLVSRLCLQSSWSQAVPSPAFHMKSGARSQICNWTGPHSRKPPPADMQEIPDGQ